MLPLFNWLCIIQIILKTFLGNTDSILLKLFYIKIKKQHFIYVPYGFCFFLYYRRTLDESKILFPLDISKIKRNYISQNKAQFYVSLLSCVLSHTLCRNKEIIILQAVDFFSFLLAITKPTIGLGFKKVTGVCILSIPFGHMIFEAPLICWGAKQGLAKPECSYCCCSCHFFFLITLFFFLISHFLIFLKIYLFI